MFSATSSHVSFGARTPIATEVMKSQELAFAFQHLLCARPGLGAERTERPWASHSPLSAWVCALALPRPSCVVLDKSESLSVPQFPPW